MIQSDNQTRQIFHFQMQLMVNLIYRFSKWKYWAPLALNLSLRLKLFEYPLLQWPQGIAVCLRLASPEILFQFTDVLWSIVDEIYRIIQFLSGKSWLHPCIHCLIHWKKSLFTFFNSLESLCWLSSPIPKHIPSLKLFQLYCELHRNLSPRFCYP